MTTETNTTGADALAATIRRVDGRHYLTAFELARALLESPEVAAIVARERQDAAAEAAEDMADELDNHTIMAILSASGGAAGYTAVRDAVKDYCHAWADKIRAAE